jgi:hypothetical protein
MATGRTTAPIVPAIALDANPGPKPKKVKFLKGKDQIPLPDVGGFEITREASSIRAKAARR